MTKLEVGTFDQCMKLSNSNKRYLLLGNGFSTALYPSIFSYSSLLEETNFSKKNEIKNIFSKLMTSDFEIVIKAIENSSEILKIYDGDKKLQKQLKAEAKWLKDALVETIASRHPKKATELQTNAAVACNRFLENFKIIYSLNYDVLLYWVLLAGKENNPNEIDDGFRNPDSEFGENFRVFDSPHSPNFFYLHGGLHLFDAGSEVRKYVWLDTGIPIIQQVKEALSKNMYPLFVAEGTSTQKLTKINHSAYLSKALRSFESIAKIGDADVFIFGHSLAENDDHVLNKIRKGICKRVFVSIFKHPKNGYDKNLIARAKSLSSERSTKKPLEVIFFDAGSANVWGGDNV